MSFLCDIGKQWRPKPDASERGIFSGSPLFAYITLKQNENYHQTPFEWKWTGQINNIRKFHLAFINGLNQNLNTQWQQQEIMHLQLGDNCIQNFHLGRYIVGYTVGNLDLRRRVSGAVKRDFRTYFRRYTSPNENFEYGYLHSNALLNFSLKRQ